MVVRLVMMAVGSVVLARLARLALSRGAARTLAKELARAKTETNAVRMLIVGGLLMEW